jgi:hypothetical protein
MKIVYIISYIIALLTSIGILYIFKPYKYIDNATSLIICSKDSRSYEAGWNFIYSFDVRLDVFNVAKAGKLCEYGIIKDYGNTVKTPSETNYRFKPKYIQESSWGDAILMFFAAFILGGLIIQLLFPKLTFKTTLTLLIIALTTSPIVFFLLIKNPAVEIFCARQVARKVNNFKRVIFKYGIFPIPEEDTHIKSVIPGLYQTCLSNEGI